jgi:hypothetical protein
MLWLGVDFPWLALEVVSAADRGREAAPTEATPTATQTEAIPTAATPSAATPSAATASVGAASRPRSDPPRAVIENGRVVLRNEAAVRAGIALGSTLATAHSIMPGLAHYPRDRQAERQRLVLLAEVLYGFSPRVCMAPETAGIALEIGGSLRLFGDRQTLEQRIEALCGELGHRVRIRCATTALAAMILARSDAPSLGEVALRHAAVEPQRLSAERIERLANMGIHTLQQLTNLPAKGLARRFGPDLVDYLERISGKRPDPRRTIRPAEHFCMFLQEIEKGADRNAVIVKHFGHTLGLFSGIPRLIKERKGDGFWFESVFYQIFGRCFQCHCSQ